MNDHHRELHALLASLGHASRFRIALRLLEHEHSVGELALAIGLSQSCTTRHVQVLERAGVVASRRDGKRVLVGIERDRLGLAALIDWLGPVAGLAVSPLEPRPPAEAPPRRREQPREWSARRPRPQGRKAPITRPAPTVGPRAPNRPAQPTQEEPPAGRPASGTHPAPVDAGERPPRRARDTIEDYLL
jgi:DNA-binding transcriptional ArsR family regulator